ncbi:serine/threonine-protein kinase [Gordonia phosphorivorans]|uniref:non-specific serine/threonine protein kinase n=1 Tax=Gordonia phosphorivorans TaxID=1056982 RepID=A0ABV6HB56_9ACTN
MNVPVPGGVFAGYEVHSLLGRGGMGSVFLVTNPHLNRREALKVLTVDADGDFAARFAAEARTVASLDHPGIVTVYHHGITDDLPWFTMQYLAGEDLASADRLPVDQVAEIVGRAGAALDYAHGRGVVHRDVKPANLMVARGTDGTIERVTVLDFGIARLAGASSLTAANTFVGTLSYAAPENISGRRDSPAGDQYSLACTAYELLTGRPPFAGLPTPALLNAQLSQSPPPISAASPALGGLDAVFARALAKDPAQRYRTCGDFAAALAGSRPDTRQPTLVGPVPGLTGPHPAAPSPPPPPPPTPSAPRSASRPSGTTVTVSVITILLGLAVIIAAIVLATGGEDTGSAATSPTSVVTAAPTSSPAPAQVWGIVVSPQGRVVRFKNYDSSATLLAEAATHGYDDDWGHVTFTTGCAAVAHATGAGAGDYGYYAAAGASRAEASQSAVHKSEQATGRTSTAVSTLCVGDALS